jgi:hypothetical protein
MSLFGGFTEEEAALCGGEEFYTYELAFGFTGAIQKTIPGRDEMAGN